MKMKNSLLKKTTAGLFTVATVLTMAAASTTALAETTIENTDNNRNDNIVVQFGKTLHFSNTVTLPEKGYDNKALWFAFQFTPVESTVCAVNEMPTIGKDTVTVTTKNEGGASETTKTINNVVAITGFSSDIDDNSDKDKSTGKGIITLESEDIIVDDNFTRAGEYIYEVSELSESNFVANNHTQTNDGWFTDSMTYDSKKYRMHVIVKNKATVTESDKNPCYVEAVYFREVVASQPSADTYTKVTNSDGSEGYELAAKVNTASLFDNAYVKEAGKNPNANNSKSSLGITKTVTGKYGDKDKEFDFTIKLYEPNDDTLLNAIVKNASDFSSLTVKDGEITAITAYVQNISDASTAPTETNGQWISKVTLTKNDNNDEWIATEVEYADTNKKAVKNVNGVPFQLTDGQYLTFESLPAGFSYTVTEVLGDDDKNYTASAKIFENIDLRHSGDSYTVTIGEKETTLNPIQQRLDAIANNIQITNNDDNNHSYPVWIASTSANKDIISVTKNTAGSSIITTDYTSNYDNTSNKLLIGEHDNSFDVINAFDDTSITPTGLIVKNLPFIVMIGLGVLAFLGLTKKRRAND